MPKIASFSFWLSVLETTLPSQLPEPRPWPITLKEIFEFILILFYNLPLNLNIQATHYLEVTLNIVTNHNQENTIPTGIIVETSNRKYFFQLCN